MNDNTYIDLLESIAESNDLLLSDNLIQFASAIWKLAYKQNGDNTFDTKKEAQDLIDKEITK